MSQISEWSRLATQLKEIKAKEAELRRELCALIIAATPMKNGRVTVKQNLDGFACKAIQTLSFKVDQAVLANIWETLQPVEKQAIKFVPDLRLKEYKALPSDSLLHEAITTSLAMPTLEAKAPE